MRLTFRSGISSLIFVLIILLIMFPGCSKPDNQGAADEGDGKYFNLTYEDNDAGFYNPARLARAVPKSISRFEYAGKSMGYVRGYKIGIGLTDIMYSKFAADYISNNNNNRVNIMINDWFNTPRSNEEDYTDTISVNGHVFGKSAAHWYYISGRIAISLGYADKSQAKALASALDWEYIDNGFK